MSYNWFNIKFINNSAVDLVKTSTKCLSIGIYKFCLLLHPDYLYLQNTLEIYKNDVLIYTFVPRHYVILYPSRNSAIVHDSNKPYIFTRTSHYVVDNFPEHFYENTLIGYNLIFDEAAHCVIAQSHCLNKTTYYYTITYYLYNLSGLIIDSYQYLT